MIAVTAIHLFTSNAHEPGNLENVETLRANGAVFNANSVLADAVTRFQTLRSPLEGDVDFSFEKKFQRLYRFFLLRA